MLAETSRKSRVAVHAALADPHRLAIVDELAMSDRSPSELATTLEIGSNLLAHHLRVLQEAGVVERLSSSGDARRRYVRLVPDAVAAIAHPVATLAARHVLFVCTANSARSQLAAAVWNARHDVPASSAGTQPAEAVRLEAIEAASRVGLDLRPSSTRSIHDVSERPDVVVTVCDIAHEDLPSFAPHVKLFHWSIADPTKRRTRSPFDDALAEISSRVEAFAPHVRPLGARRKPR
jgi:ArsR family transcriptional regulator, arsenate/arsenite/antimonite-responsive transcriptional repressor / arsenate reductase (thioredoxin)